jgi:endoglucanase
MRMRGLRRSHELGFGTHAVGRGLLVAAAALGSLSVACGRPAPAVSGGSAGSETPAAESLAGNPFAGNRVYRAPYSNAENAQQRLQKTNPADALLIGKIAAQPQASWYGGWSGDIQTVVGNYVNASERAGELALLVAYNVPNRDCGQYSAGGASDSASYAEWIKGVAAGIGQRRAVVVLEPDALGLLTQCLSPEDQEKRLQLIHQAVTVLEAQPGVAVYIDAGHSGWVPAAEMAQRLERAGIAEARGFALNTSNYQADAALLQYGKELIQALGVDTHFIIDSSRNGNGPAPAGDPENWCNPEGRALGRAPTTDTGEAPLDAFVWLKRPGESDGACKGGPAAGQWFEARALEMARNAKW